MLTVVIGPPASGKSTWCRQHAGPDDVIIDYDLIANALSAPREGESQHSHPAAVKSVAKAARKAAIERALTIEGADVYLIHSTPSARLLDRYRDAGARIVTVDPGMDVVMERAKRERPWQMQQVVKRWYAQADPAKGVGKDVRSTTERGLGWRHQKQRDRLVAGLVDGTACWWCGKPMYRDKAANFDGAPVEADHTLARSKGGDLADRLLHRRCNRSRGNGSRDHLRPTAQPPPDQPRATRRWL